MGIVGALVLAGLLGRPRGVGARPVPTRGELRMLAIRAGFPDRPLSNPPMHVAGAPDALLDRLVAYYAEVSAGRLQVVPLVGTTTVTVPGPRVSYVQRPDALARDALLAFAAASSDPDDHAALARADAVIVFFAGAGRESHTQSGSADDPWSNYTPLSPPLRAGGGTFEDACVIAEDEVPPFSSFGVLCHEFGHLLGLPELYAPGGAPQEGIGVWGLMGQGTWLRRGQEPPQLCAWSKLTLGWVEVETIERSTRVVLPAVERVPRVVKIPVHPDRAEEYYLLENRARVGADRSLPGEGLLVWHVDEGVTGFRTGQRDVTHKLLHLVEADEHGDLDRGHAAGGNRGDADDPWAGPPWWRRRVAAVLVLVGAGLVAAAVLRGVRPRPLRPVAGLLVVAGLCLGIAQRLQRGPECGPDTPGMAPYDGSRGRVTLRNLSPAGPEMHFDVLIEPASATGLPRRD